MWDLFCEGNSPCPQKASFKWKIVRSHKWRHRQSSSQREIWKRWHIGREMDYTPLVLYDFLRKREDSLSRLSRLFRWLTHTFWRSVGVFLLFRASDRCGKVEENSAANTRYSNYRLLVEWGCQASWLAGDTGFLPSSPWQSGVKN